MDAAISVPALEVYPGAPSAERAQWKHKLSFQFIVSVSRRSLMSLAAGMITDRTVNKYNALFLLIKMHLLSLLQRARTFKTDHQLMLVC